MKAQERKIVFFDIDQTIWNYKNEIPESTIRGIHRLQEQGHLAFINSGRSRSFIRHEDLDCLSMFQGECIPHPDL